MRFPGRKAAAEPEVAAPPEPDVPTVGKGRPTPKRREAEGVRRGPVAPPPMTQKEAVRRARAQTTTPMTKDERKVAGRERRERMMRGDDAYILPRDRGPVRAYVRDLVDSRRNLAGLLMPVAVLSFLVLLVNVPVLTVYGPLVMLVIIAVSLVDTAIFTRQLKRKIAVKFPKGDPAKLSTRGGSLGFYAFNRAILPRRWRVPRARVKPGDRVE